MAQLIVHITGLDELQRKLTPLLAAAPARRFFTRSAIAVQSAARERAPVDRGRLRNSIAYQLDGAILPRWAKVGTNVSYAPYVHEGTKPHFPPPTALAGWAGRHGFGKGGGFLVAKGIAAHGTKPHPFLTDGLAASEGQIRGFLSVMAAEIEAGAAI